MEEIGDQNTREQALDCSCSFLVQAPAGSGKTELLTQRLLKLLAQVEKPTAVLALTFTRKAASEMQQRLLKALQNAQEPAPESKHQYLTWQLANRALANAESWRLLENPNQLQITTIDAFCARLVRSAPLLSGCGFTPQIHFDPNSLYLQAANAVLAKLEDNSPWADAIATLLQHLDNHIGKAQTLLAQLLTQREQWLPYLTQQTGRALKASLEKALHLLIENTLQQTHDLFPEALRTQLADILSFLQQQTCMTNKAPPDVEPFFTTAAMEQFSHNEKFTENKTSITETLLQKKSPSTWQKNITEKLKLSTEAFTEKATHSTCLENSATLSEKDNHPTYLKNSITTSEKNATLAHKPFLAQIALWRQIADLLLTQTGQWRKTVSKKQGFLSPSAIKDSQLKAQAKQYKEQMISLLTALNQEKYDSLKESLVEVQQLPPLFYNQQQWQLINALSQILPLLAAQLHLIFSEQQSCDYTEIALASLQTLGDEQAPTDLTLLLDYQLQHILVDEFQDTSLLQFRLLEKLTAGWQTNDGRTLFLVGDPMQSIYRFRKAEVGLFLKAKQQGINQTRLTFLQLSRNFRSQQKLIDWFNESFIKIFPPQEDIISGKISYCQAQATLPALTIPAVTVHAHCNSQSQSQNIIAIIKNQQQQDINASIAILVQARSHLTELLPALQKANIDYQAHEIESLLENPLIIDLLSLTQALLFPADRLAWLACLRAPWCGLQLPDVHLLAYQKQNQTILQRLIQAEKLGLSSDGLQRAKRFYQIMASSLQQRARRSLSTWVTSAWYALGGPAVITSEQLTIAERFFQILFHCEQQTKNPSIAAIKQQLTCVSEKQNSSQSATVAIMTIHKAKGLEFDVVILPHLEKSLQQDQSQLMLWQEITSLTQSAWLIAPMRASEQKFDPIYRCLQQQAQKQALQEKIRLFYVACTRAKKSLHLLASVSIDQEKETLRPARQSLLALIWPIVKDNFSNLLTLEENEQTSLDKEITGTQININNSQHNGVVDNQQNKQIENSTEINLTSIDSTASCHIRLASNWQVPEILSPSLRLTADNPIELITSLTPFIQQQIGNVIHLLLYQMSLQPIKDSESLVKNQFYIENLLSEAKLSGKTLKLAQKTVVLALTNTLRDPRGRWLLDKHQHAHSEYAITIYENNQAQQLIIDRTFVDQQNTRWIIDYKTSELSALAQQQQQLHRYYHAIKQIEDRTIHLALYFPLTKEWLEVANPSTEI